VALETWRAMVLLVFISTPWLFRRDARCKRRTPQLRPAIALSIVHVKGDYVEGLTVIGCITGL